MKTDRVKDLLESEFAALGFNFLYYNKKPSANGVDLWVKKNAGRPLSVEIKKVRKLKNGTYQCDSVQKNRINDDLIAIIINSEYVLIEPMKHHLNTCSPRGTRQFTLLCRGN